jgi:hypothetical protein
MTSSPMAPLLQSTTTTLVHVHIMDPNITYTNHHYIPNNKVKNHSNVNESYKSYYKKKTSKIY